MSHGRRFARQISSYIDGELSPRRAARLIAHIERCEQCRSTLMAYRTLRNGVEKLDVDRVPTVPRRTPRWIGVAAALILAVGASLAYTRLSRENEDFPGSAVPVTTTSVYEGAIAKYREAHEAPQPSASFSVSTALARYAVLTSPATE